MSIIKEFKSFALRGNVVDLAVGVIIGAAFSKIVDSLVKDIIMPIVGIAGDSDFSNLYFGFSEKGREAFANGLTLAQAREVPNVGSIFAYGSFLTVSLNFLILAFIIFLMVKAINSLQRKEEANPTVTPPPPTLQETLLMEIRDELKQTPRA